MVSRENAIEFKNVFFNYSSGFKIEDMSFKIGYGEVVVFLGANGSGKTTVLKLIAGLLKPVKGRVFVAGYDTLETPLSILARFIGYIPQSPWYMFSQETVYKEITFTSRNLGLPEDFYKRQALYIASWLGLVDKMDRTPFSLSEGEARRLAIASAVTHNPKIILLDEPTSALDYIGRKKFLEILNDLIDRGYTVVIATHDIDFTVKLGSPRVIVLNNGRIVFDGRTSDLYREQAILEDNNLIPPQITRLMNIIYSLSNDESIYCELSIENLIEYIVFNKKFLREKIGC